MKRMIFFSLVFASCFNAMSASPNDTLIIGTWKGTSICQIKSSPCHDEMAVYHVAKGSKPGVFRFAMNKVVNGVEEDMGTMDYLLDNATQTLTNIDEARNAVWKFSIKGSSMDGTLYYKGQLYRIITLTKDSGPH